jgi:DNA-binding XRE family transcriptional regulator
MRSTDPIGAEVARHRRAVGLEQQAFARLCGVRRESDCRIESDQRTPGPQLARGMEEVLETFERAHE